MYHFGMIVDKTPNDYLVLESILVDPITNNLYWSNLIKNSVRQSPLSLYDGFPMTILRPNLPGSADNQTRLRNKAVHNMYNLTHVGYDAEGLMQKAVKNYFTMGKPPWDFDRIKKNPEPRYTCIGTVTKAWEDAGYPIIPPGVYPLPAAIENSVRTGRLTIIYRDKFNKKALAIPPSKMNDN
jgi:hypothetical protein